LRKFEPPEQNNFNTKTMPALYLLYESAHGYALLEAYGLDTIGACLDGVQKSVTELDRFGKVRDPFFFRRRGMQAVVCLAASRRHGRRNPSARRAKK
jgi:hypothetical protein